ncbi:penicillin-binding protein activator [Acinetobacter sp. WZC-1]|uniref:penicillin-binding protein activator n=1 Tax=Acinetobacter sp. WZC-1 TaxID=3459034 RepID=UPI00403D7C18
MIQKLNNNSILLGLGLLGIMSAAQAEILIILPESGPMARAGISIKQGILSAYQSSGGNIPLKFMNSDQQTIPDILKTGVNKKTRMVIGPLARSNVEALIRQKPGVPVLALNEVPLQHKNVWQYSLSKDADASALIGVLEKDWISRVSILRQAGAEAESLTFLNALHGKYADQVEMVDSIPAKLDKHQGLLILGTNQWMNQIKKLPRQQIYTSASAVEDRKPLPRGLKFCDVPALYEARWQDVIGAYQKNPVSMPYQRLLAFGGDAWHIAAQFVLEPRVRNLSFSGRTGQIFVQDHRVQRTPQCFENTGKGLVTL